MEYIELYIGLMLLGAVGSYFTHKQAYEKGITDAVLMHRTGRLKYKDYLDKDGAKMVDIEIDPIEGDEE